MNILVIDENERPQEPHKQAREPIGPRLIRAGYNVRSTWYGQTGVNLFNATATSPKFDLVIVGWQMVDMTGQEVIRRLRQEGPYVTRIMLLSCGLPDISHFQYLPNVRFDIGSELDLLVYVKAIELMLPR